MVFQILPNKLDYIAGEQVTIQVTADPDVTWDLEVIKDGGAILFYKEGTGSQAFNISLVIAENGAGDYQIVGATRYVEGFDSVIIHVTPGTGDWSPPVTPVNNYELKIHYLDLGWGSPDALESFIVAIVDAVNPILSPMGYTFTNRYKNDKANKILSLYFTGHTEPVTASIIATLLLAIAAVLVAIGFVVWRLEFLKNAETVAKLTHAKADSINIFDELLRENKITPEEYTLLLQGLESVKIPEVNKPTDWGNIVMMLGALAIGAFLLKDVIGGRK